MTAGDIIEQARVYLNDGDKSEYEDTELITYLNDALSLTENLLADNLSSITLKVAEFAASPALLPGDFLKADRAEYKGSVLRYKERARYVSDGEYSIIGDELIISRPPVTFYYYKTYPRAEGPQSPVDIYKPLETALKDYIVIKALSRLEYNTQDEAARLAELTGSILTIARRRDGLIKINGR